MEFAEFAQPTVSGRGTQLNVKHGGDENLIVEFYMEPVLQGHESEKEGRQIFKDVPFIWIRFPGDRTRERRRRVDMRGKDGAIPDPDRFPRQWSAFQRKHAQVQEGTPIENWGPISKSQALTYKGLNVHTVENLAAVNDTALHNLGHGARMLRDKAIAWIKASKDSAETMRLAAENQQLRDDLAALKEQVAELAAKRKPGRPRKEESDESEGD
jgi:hypothetical protein